MMFNNNVYDRWSLTKRGHTLRMNELYWWDLGHVYCFIMMYIIVGRSQRVVAVLNFILFNPITHGVFDQR